MTAVISGVYGPCMSHRESKSKPESGTVGGADLYEAEEANPTPEKETP